MACVDCHRTSHHLVDYSSTTTSEDFIVDSLSFSSAILPTFARLRAVHVRRQIAVVQGPYNDIAAWRHGDLVKAMAGGDGGGVQTYMARSTQELDSLIEGDQPLARGPGLRVVEVFMPKRDAPLSLRLTAEASAKNNARE